MAIKVAVIGAGSIGFTRLIMQDILTVPELRDTADFLLTGDAPTPPSTQPLDDA